MRAHKNEYLIEIEERGLALRNIVAHCMPKCLTKLETSVIVTEESECLTNCTVKGLEVNSLFRLWNADKDLKRYGGLKM